MSLTRREFAKAQAAAIAAAAAGLPIASTASNLITDAEQTTLDWNKAPCRFCGTGCSVMVATKNGRVVATHGDVKAEVNRGLNCVKGYFLSKIMYGSDRLTQPTAAHEEWCLRQAGRIPASELGTGVFHHGREDQSRAQGPWPRSHRHVRLRPVDGVGRLRGQQADEGRPALQQHRPQRPPLHGLGGDGLHAQLRHGRADGLLRRHRSHRHLRALGLEHGRDASGALDPGNRSPPQRATGQGRGAVDLRAQKLRPGRHPHGVQAADRPDHPQLHRQPHHPKAARSIRTSSAATPSSPRAPTTSATACAPPTRWNRRRKTPPPPTPGAIFPSSSSPPSSNPTRWNAPPKNPGCRPNDSRLWQSCMPIPSARSCRSGPWVSTSTPAACGPTT